MESNDQAVRRAIAAISQSDPLVKLVHQISLGRIKPTDAGLQAVTVSWLATYGAALGGTGLSKASLRRIDPQPRVDALIQVGVLSSEHPSVLALQTTYRQIYENASD